MNKNKLGNDEVVINNVIIPKRLMFNQQKVIQNGVKLSYDHSFGFYQTPIRKNAYFINDDDLIYPNGKHLIKYDMMKKKQTFILKNMEDEQITAMKFHHSRGANRTLIAVALKSSAESIALVRVYYLSKNFSYNLVHSHLSTQVDVIDVTFLYKGKFLVSLAEVEKEKVYKLTLWNVEHEKYIWEQNVDAYITELDNCIAASKIFSCGGPQFFQVWNYEVTEKSVYKVEKDTDYVLSYLNLKESNEEFTTHCWAKEDNMLIICTNFHIYIFKNMEFKEKIVFIYPDADLQTLIMEQVFKDDGIYYEKAMALNYLIDINMPSGGMYKDGKLPDMLLEMFNERYSYGDLNREANDFSIAKKEFEDKLTAEEVRQLLHDRDDDILEKFTPIYVLLMREILFHLKVRINCICPQENGFAVGMRGSGIVCLYKEKNEKHVLENSSKIQNREVSYIHSLSSSNDNSHIVVVAKIKQKFNTTVTEEVSGMTTSDGILEAFIFNSSLVNAIKVSYKEPFEFLDPYGPHSGGIMSIALCPSKSIVGTLSVDKTLKFWNYTSSEKQMFSYEFHMSQQAFDIHPMSIQCAVGFKEGIKIYFMLENDLENAYKNFTKSCNAVKYSEGGHFLAIGIVNQIHIVCPYRLIKYEALTGHSGNVSKLRWKNRDKYLLSLCSNSIVFVWDVNNNWDQLVEHYISNKNHKYLDVDYDAEFDLLLCCCTDRTVKFFRNKGGENYLNYETEGNIYTSLYICKRFKVCFFGCDDGSLKIFLWPFIRIGRSKFEYMHIAVHQEKITDIRVGYNQEHLITASSDGSVFFLGIKEIAKGKDITVGDILTTINEKDEGNDNLTKISNTFNLNDFAMLSSKMEGTMQEKIKSLDRDIHNTISAIEENNENITESYNRRIRKIEQENQAILKKRNIELANQMDIRGSEQKKLDIKIKRLENKLKDIVKTKEEFHRNELLLLYAERDQIKKDKDKYEHERNEQINEMTEKFVKVLDEIQKSYEDKKSNISQKSKKAMFNLKSDQMMFQEALRQAEEDYNQDLHHTVKDLESRYEKVKTEGELLRSKNSKYEKDIERNKERSSNLDNLIAETQAQNDQLEKEINHFQHKCDEMQSQLEEQETIINMKENMIKEFRNMNYHLQNYKSVYDYQVSTLKEEHEPLNEYVENLEKHIKTMYSELLYEANSNSALKKNVLTLKSNVKSAGKEVEQKKKFLMLTQRRFDNLEHEMSLLLEGMSTNPVFIQQLTKLLQEQMGTILRTEDILTKAKNNSVNEIMENKKMHSLEKLSAMELQSIKEDLLRQRDLMSKRLYRRTQRNKILEKERENVYKSIQEEGKMLIYKCNMLRKEGLLLMYKIGLAKKEAEELTAKMKKNFNDKKKFFKKDQPGRTGGSRKKKKTLLPIEHYREKNKPRNWEKNSDDVEADLGYPHIQEYRKEVDNLYKKLQNLFDKRDDLNKRRGESEKMNIEENDFELLQEKGHNFKIGDDYI